jgi:hypothetical protein
MQSEEWIVNYLSIEVIANKSFDKDLLAKLLGEFCLFCYLVNRERKLPKALYDLLKKIEKTYVSLSHFDVLLESCLGKTPNLINIKNNLQAMEIGFLKYEFLDIKSNWAECICQYIKLLNADSINSNNSYLLTHIIFYSTNFGTTNYWQERPSLLNVILELLDLCEQKFRIENNWDLLREIYLSQLYVGSRNKDSLVLVLESEDYVIKSIQGWFLSDGTRIDHFEKNYNKLSYQEKYSLFHTTVISLLLWYEVDSTKII